jgi:hypothetical protein
MILGIREGFTFKDVAGIEKVVIGLNWLAMI